MKKHLFYIMLLFIIFFGLANAVKETRGVQQHSPQPDQRSTFSVQEPEKDTTKTVRSAFKEAPTFTLTNLKGERVSLADFRGRKVLVNMWATWCGPCRQEMPELVNIDQTFPDNKLAVIGVNMTTEELSVKDVRVFTDQFSVGYPILLDDKGSVMGKYRVIGIPTSFLINEDGMIIHEFRGIVTMEKLKKFL